jgi:hypothetical protein
VERHVAWKHIIIVIVYAYDISTILKLDIFKITPDYRVLLRIKFNLIRIRAVVRVLISIAGYAKARKENTHESNYVAAANAQA